MRNRLARAVLSLVAGSIGVAIGLYFGRFIATAVGGAVAIAASGTGASLATIALATSISWWAFIGLAGGLAWAFSALKRRRLLFVVISVAGFALGGLIAALPEMNRADRASALAALAAPVGGALAGLLIGLAARLRIRSALMPAVGAAAMAIAGPQIGSVLPSPNWIALLAPGALVGAALSALAPDESTSPPA
jgi:hypothetical protein